ncbi:moricin-1-like [Ostrinia furnacalis]|uniref:moricin-1-like n=1 Tax=Ostrinia furnacalis TaxID=93504 RepID=UPI00103F8299|nr:moricin-1-like [Ostrinia furnacalis]
MKFFSIIAVLMAVICLFSVNSAPAPAPVPGKLTAIKTAGRYIGKGLKAIGAADAIYDGYRFITGKKH